MNREEILRMAREAGIKNDCDGIWCNADQLEHFARLVYESVFRDANMAASATIIDAAVLEEREACAKLCEKTNYAYGSVFAKPIRARGKE